MNNSKKLQTKKVKKSRLIEQKPITKISLPWIIASAVLVLALIVAMLFDQLYAPALVKVDGKKYTVYDLAYYLYSVESNYEYYDSMFGGNGAYWDMTYDESTGATMRDAAKEEAIQSAIGIEILYNQAISENYTLTDEEKENISTQVDSVWSNQLTASVISKNRFTKAKLTDIIGKTTLADRYRNDRIAALNIDEEAIKAEINYEDYRQYDVDYLFISTKTTNDDGESVDMTEDEKKAAFDKITEVLDQVATTEDWSTLVPEDETELTYSDDYGFTKSTGTFSDDLKSVIMAMNNGDVSDILEDPDKGYYIVKMVNNNSTESYDTEVENAITDEENEQFNTLYQEEILPNHSYTIYENALKRYTMGSITLAD